MLINVCFSRVYVATCVFTCVRQNVHGKGTIQLVDLNGHTLDLNGHTLDLYGYALDLYGHVLVLSRNILTDDV